MKPKVARYIVFPREEVKILSINKDLRHTQRDKRGKVIPTSSTCLDRVRPETVLRLQGAGVWVICILMQSCWATGQVCDAYVRTQTIYVQSLLGLKRTCLCKFSRNYFLSRNFVNFTKIVPISTSNICGYSKTCACNLQYPAYICGKDKINFAKVCEDLQSTKKFENKAFFGNASFR